MNHFDPSGFDPDIYGVEVKGLGRGKGVKVTGRYSLLARGDPTVALIKDRILTLINVLIEHDCLTERDVRSVIRIPTAPPTALAAKDTIITALGDETVTLKRQLTQLTQSRGTQDAVIKNLSSETVQLTRRVNALREQLQTRDTIIEDLSEDNVRLKQAYDDLESDRDHRLHQATKLFHIAKRQKARIASLKAQVEDLSEALVA